MSWAARNKVKFKNCRLVITPEQADHLRTLASEGKSYSEAAKILGRNKDMVTNWAARNKVKFKDGRLVITPEQADHLRTLASEKKTVNQAAYILGFSKKKIRGWAARNKVKFKAVISAITPELADCLHGLIGEGKTVDQAADMLGLHQCSARFCATSAPDLFPYCVKKPSNLRMCRFCKKSFLPSFRKNTLLCSSCWFKGNELLKQKLA